MIVKGDVFTHCHTLGSAGQAETGSCQASADPANDVGGMPLSLAALGAELRFMLFPGELHNQLAEIADQRKIPVTWNKRHTEYVCRVDPADRLFDAAGFCDLVRQDAFDYRLQEDSGGKLMRAFWPLHSHDIVGTLGGVERVVIYDNTFNTSRYDLKLGVFTTVDHNGKTRMVACTLMRHEDVESFVWVLRAFRDIFKVKPRVFLTDGDLWLIKAIEKIFPTAVHHLCVWHLARNVAKHVKGCFGAVRKRGEAQNSWHQWYSAFWRILLRTDSATVASFDDEWGALLALLRESSSASEGVVDDAVVYLGEPPSPTGGEPEGESDPSPDPPPDRPSDPPPDESAEQGDEQEGEQEGTPDHNVYNLRKKWAYRYTWRYFTMGCNSTQRGEGVFKEIKSKVRPGGLLVHLSCTAS